MVCEGVHPVHGTLGGAHACTLFSGRALNTVAWVEYNNRSASSVGAYYDGEVGASVGECWLKDSFVRSENSCEMK